MSRITLIKKLFSSKTEMARLPVLISTYGQLLEEVPVNLSIKGKTIAEANREQASHLFFYAEQKAEVKALMEAANAWVDRTRGQLYLKIIESSARDLNDRAIDKIIDSKDEYCDVNEVYLEIKELYEKFSAVVQAFESRGFALRNITDARINQVQNELI